jgi:hypothetical protein
MARSSAAHVQADQLVTESLPRRTDGSGELARHDLRRVDQAQACMMARS